MLDPFNVVECVKMMIFSLILLFGLNSVFQYFLHGLCMYLVDGDLDYMSAFLMFSLASLIS